MDFWFNSAYLSQDESVLDLVVFGAQIDFWSISGSSEKCGEVSDSSQPTIKG